MQCNDSFGVESAFKAFLGEKKETISRNLSRHSAFLAVLGKDKETIPKKER